uniref:Uncharacterized protein n=1 Tax=Anguilla anguilla TaxID=7936 RepID=A0A0E9R5V3_ANGAN
MEIRLVTGSHFHLLASAGIALAKRDKNDSSSNVSYEKHVFQRTRMEGIHTQGS